MLKRLAVLLVAGLLGVVAPASAQPGGRVVLNDVHTDVIHVQYVDGELSLRTRIGLLPEESFADAEQVLFQLRDNDSSRVAVPDDPAYAFLGPAGAPIWVAPQSQVPSLLYAGWDTESIPLGVLAGDAVDIRLVSATGPGIVEVFQVGSFGEPLRVFSSQDQNIRNLHQPVASHVHANWAFSALGRYELTFEATGADLGGRPLSSGPVTYTWHVGDLPPEPTTTTPPPTTTTTTTTTTTGTTPGTTTGTTTSGATTTTTSCVPATATAPPGQAVVLRDGHVDYAARIVGGGLASVVKDGTVAGTTTWREPGRVVFHVVPAAATTVPAGPFGFLGNPGDRIWQIPQTQRAGILWLGWNTEEISAAQVRGPVTWSLDRVDGPGKMAIFLFDPFGQPQIVFNSGDGVPDRYEIPLGTHAHGNWTFTREGVYRVRLTQTATLASGGQVSDTETVTFAVGAVDPNTAVPAGAPAPQAGVCAGGGTTVAASLARTGTGGFGGRLALGGLLVVAGATIVVIARRRTVSAVDGGR